MDLNAVARSFESLVAGYGEMTSLLKVYMEMLDNIDKRITALEKRIDSPVETSAEISEPADGISRSFEY